MYTYWLYLHILAMPTHTDYAYTYWLHSTFTYWLQYTYTYWLYLYILAAVYLHILTTYTYWLYLQILTIPTDTGCSLPINMDYTYTAATPISHTFSPASSFPPMPFFPCSTDILGHPPPPLKILGPPLCRACGTWLSKQCILETCRTCGTCLSKAVDFTVNMWTPYWIVPNHCSTFIVDSRYSSTNSSRKGI